MKAWDLTSGRCLAGKLINKPTAGATAKPEDGAKGQGPNPV